MGDTKAAGERGQVCHVGSSLLFPPTMCRVWRGTCFFFFKIFFLVLMWTIFKVFIEFVTILPLFYSLVFWPQGM